MGKVPHPFTMMVYRLRSSGTTINKTRTPSVIHGQVRQLAVKCLECSWLNQNAVVVVRPGGFVP